MTTTGAAPPRRAVVPRQRSAGAAPVQPRRTQAQRRAESERRLLEAAAELIVERGIEGTSLAEIGRLAGYSHGLVHHRFGSKDALIERLNGEAVRLFSTRTIDRIGTARGASAVRVVAQTYLDLVQGPDPVARVHLMVWSEAVAGGAGKRPYRASWDQVFRGSLAGLIESGIADGSVRGDIDPVPTAVVLVGMLRGVALQLLLDPEAGSPGEMRDLVLDHVDRMLRPATPGPLSPAAGR